MVLINHEHEFFEAVLRLEPLLSGFALLLGFFLEDGELRGVRFLLFVDFDLCGDQVGLDALDHVLVLALLHHFEVGSFLYRCHICGGVVFRHRSNVLVFLNKRLLILLSVKFAL